ncbi:hypothetical protein SAMN04487963_0021, partial [Marinobacter zhejiangensis]
MDVCSNGADRRGGAPSPMAGGYYGPTAYRSSHIPTLPPGGHAKMDRAFQRLPWGHYISPVVPNTMNAQLAYARLFMEEKDAENGFPWGETIFAINKGFLKWLLGSLYILYLCAWLSMCVFLVPMVIEIIALLSNSPTIAGAIKIAKGYGIIYLGLSVLYFVGKYGRLFLASFNEKRLRSDPTGLYR